MAGSPLCGAWDKLSYTYNQARWRDRRSAARWVNMFFPLGQAARHSIVRPLARSRSAQRRGGVYVSVKAGISSIPWNSTTSRKSVRLAQVKNSPFSSCGSSSGFAGCTILIRKIGNQSSAKKTAIPAPSRTVPENTSKMKSRKTAKWKTPHSAAATIFQIGTRSIKKEYL